MKERKDTPHVGTRIRMFRERRKLSLRKLSESSGLSVNAIGMIERGENSPTVSSLHSLAEALRVRIIDFFEDSHEHAVVVVRKEQRLTTTGECGTMESLGQGLRNQQSEPFLVSLEAGCPGDGLGTESDRDNRPVQHSGEEFVYCIEGVIEYEISDALYVLKAGDSLIFDATQPHRFRNPTADPAQFLIVFQAVDGAPAAVQRHLQGQ